MLLSLSMPTIFNFLDRPHSSSFATTILIPPCFYAPLLQSAYGVMGDNRAVQFFKNR